MQNNSSKLLKDNPNTDQSSKNIILWIGVVLPLLIFTASSGYAVIALWRAKSLQALAPAGLPFGVWVGNDITWAMKLSILSAGYFSVFLTYLARKMLWQEKAKLGILALLALVQGLLCFDYLAKLQWFADDGVTAKGLVIIGFSSINTFLLVQKSIKERFIGLFSFNKKIIYRIYRVFDFLFWDYPSQLWQKHRQTLIFLAGSFLFVLLMYGGKVFFTSYVTDDYARFFLAKGSDEFVFGLGRWVSALLNNNIFFGPRHILPYFNTL